jgi:hypothetical protein
MPRALSARASILAHSIVAGDQNDLIISLDYCRTAAYFFGNRQAHRARRLPEHRDGDSQ